MNRYIKYEGVDIEILELRWEVYIKIYKNGDLVDEFIVSADSFFTNHCGIWFGTRKAYDDYIELNSKVVFDGSLKR